MLFRGIYFNIWTRTIVKHSFFPNRINLQKKWLNRKKKEDRGEGKD
jgi:hypothetical protein